MREETEQWLNRLAMGLPTQHATAEEAHDRLMLTKAFDLSARLKRAIALPIDASNEGARRGLRAAE
jgi:myo-inositol 2-dehydrogenase / D-chiro-inositol 1-dehydrogenase